MNTLNPSNVLTFIILAAIWTLPWTAIAMWKAARRKDMVWYIVLLLVHTLGILDILYIFVFSKNKPEA